MPNIHASSDNKFNRQSTECLALNVQQSCHLQLTCTYGFNSLGKQNGVINGYCTSSAVHPHLRLFKSNKCEVK